MAIESYRIKGLSGLTVSEGKSITLTMDGYGIHGSRKAGMALEQ